MYGFFIAVFGFGIFNQVNAATTTDITHHQFVILEARCALELKNEKVSELFNNLGVGSLSNEKKKLIATYIVYNEIHQCMADKVKDNK